MLRLSLMLSLVCSFARPVEAHDTWVQTNTNVLRAGDAVHIDLMLGNHGNQHRDFKLAGKVDLESCKLDVIDPAGQRYDLKEDLVDTGYAPREGFWSGRFIAAKPGMYVVAHTLDKLHRTTHAIKSGKAFFVVSRSLDKVPLSNPGYDKPLGHALELVPVKNPVTPMGPGEELSVRLLFRGEPLPNYQVTFIPRGASLSEGFDDRYERRTDNEGRATFKPTEGNYVLAVAHYARPDEKGQGFDRTHYSATLTVLVPHVCPCCGD